MNIDLTRHGGYELTWSTPGLIIVGVIMLIGILLGAVLMGSEVDEEEGPLFLASLGAFFGGCISFFIVSIALLAAGSFPVNSGMGGVKSLPRHTNFFQASKKVPDSKVTTMTLPGDFTTGSDNYDARDTDYYKAIASQVEKHYKAKVLSLEPVQLNKGSRNVDMPATVKVNVGTPQERAQECILRALDTKSDGNRSGDPATSFTGYLLCNGSEAPKR